MARSLNGWPVLRDGDPRLAVGTVPGTSIRIRARGDVLPLLLAIAARWHRNVAPLRHGECGAYDYRPARGGGGWSDHSSGTALDLNWDHEGAQGPHGGMDTMTPAQIAAAAEVKRWARIVIWGGDAARGGDYAQPKNWDPMHYAIAPGVTAAQARALIRALRIRPDGTIAPPAPAKPTHGTTRLKAPTWFRETPSISGKHVTWGLPGRLVRYARTVHAGRDVWLMTESGNYVLAARTTRGA